MTVSESECGRPGLHFTDGSCCKHHTWRQFLYEMAGTVGPVPLLLERVASLTCSFFSV